MPERRRGLAGFVLNVWMSLFVLFLVAPLMVATLPAFDGSSGASAGGAKGFGLHAFSALFADDRLMTGLLHSGLVGLAVVVLSLPLGLAGALVLDRLAGRAAGLLFAALIVPILVPGIVVGLSTLIFWRELGVPGGLLLAVLAQTSAAAAYAMMLFLVRLESFDPELMEAALDLGASPSLAMRRVLLPHLGPTALAAAAVAFLLSVGDHDMTVSSIGSDWTLLTEIAARLRLDPTPAVDAIGVLFVAATLLVAGVWVALHHRTRPRPGGEADRTRHPTSRRGLTT